MATLAIWGVPGGLIGARLYGGHQLGADTRGEWYRAFAIWQGGLGIWGGIVGGIALGYVGVRRHHLPMRPLLDCVAPAFALAQAIGRWGNYFNQELYGWRSNLPWAVKIDHPRRSRQVPPPGIDIPADVPLRVLWDLVVRRRW